MFDTYIYQPLAGSLLYLDGLVGSLGLAIIALTLIIRLVLIPLTLPSLKTANKMRLLQPELNKLKTQFKDDKVGLQQAQVKLFQEKGVNPMAGCLPQIAQIVVFIALYKVFMDSLQNGVNVSTVNFLWLNLTSPDKTFLLPVLAGITQLILSLMIMPGADTSAEKALAASTPDKDDDKKAEDMSSMANNIQQQMLFLMPVMTVVIAINFPSGLALYWIVSTLVSIGQQYYISGWGGLTSNSSKVYDFIVSKFNKY